MPITPIHDLLYILPFEETSDIGKIILSDVHQRRKKATQGIVKYRGPWTTGDIRRGDHVIYPNWAGDTMVIEGEGLLDLIPEEGISAIWEDGEDNYLLTIEQVRLAVQRAGNEVAALHEGTKEKIAAIAIADRMIDHLSNRLLEEMFY